MVALNSPPLNFPRTTGINLFLIGSNYARAFQDTEKTNKEGMKPDGNEIPLYCMVLLGIVIWLHMWMFAPVSHSSCRWHARYLPLTKPQVRLLFSTLPLFLMLQSKQIVCHSASVSLYVYEIQPAVSVSVSLAQSLGVSRWKVERYIHPSCCQMEVNPRDQVPVVGCTIDTLQTAGSEEPLQQHLKKHINRLNWSM